MFLNNPITLKDHKGQLFEIASLTEAKKLVEEIQTVIAVLEASDAGMTEQKAQSVLDRIDSGALPSNAPHPSTDTDSEGHA